MASDPSSKVLTDNSWQVPSRFPITSAITERRCDFTPVPVPAKTAASNCGDKSSALSKHNGGYPSNGPLCWAEATLKQGTEAGGPTGNDPHVDGSGELQG